MRYMTEIGWSTDKGLSVLWITEHAKIWNIGFGTWFLGYGLGTWLLNMAWNMAWNIVFESFFGVIFIFRTLFLERLFGTSFRNVFLECFFLNLECEKEHSNLNALKV